MEKEEEEEGQEEATCVKSQSWTAERITNWISCYEKQNWFYISLFLIFTATRKEKKRFIGE